ncbi:hypothetical protein [Trabulsiella odontotermitis]|uniref:Uncharacterized protein n=1 Tax=Trabulsiella odontotermitis TaxID=379893 RepID=A0A0L0GKZ8_9ENTR|nr:hypothetical protein [Trabulsiella odontotermitis]KNC89421.1 hypothetical protein GM31_07485 [Trabulsiella odontotermitis]
MKLITQNLTPANFLANGGTLVYEVDANEVDEGNPNFHQLPMIQPFLSSGFELKPTTVINDVSAAAQILAYGEDWTRFVYRVYSKGGKIIYTQINQNLYQAVCTL